MNNSHFEKFNKLFEAVSKIETKEECRVFFEDLCTIKELSDMTQRLEVALLLNEGKNYQEISKATGASSATISRVNKCFVYSNGYKDMIKKLEEEK